MSESPGVMIKRWLCAMFLLAAFGPRAVAEGSPPASAIAEGTRWKIPHPRVDRSQGAPPASSGGWWMGTAGIALALAAFGGMSVAARKFLPRPESGPLRVVGRTSLSPKHVVYLLRAGDKVLIVGTGPQGSPTLLGEMPPEAAGVPTPTLSSPMLARFRAGGGV